MLVDEEELETLLDFGLTRNQAKIFATIVHLGYASVGQVARESEVRREDVYRILPKLEKMGLVERLMGTPIRLRATPVEEALSILIKNEEDIASKRLEDLKARRGILLKRLKSDKIKPSLEDEKGDFVYLSQRDGILGKALTMIEEAEREVDLILSQKKLLQFLPNFTEALAKTLRRGAVLRILSEIPEYGQTMPKILEEYLSHPNSVELNYTSFPSGHYIITDFRQALIATNTEGSLAENPCLWTDNKSLVSILQENFENLWHNSFKWNMLETSMVSEKAVDFVEKLKPTNHVMFVYDSLEAKHNVLFNYVKAGLKGQEMVVYVSSDNSVDETRDAMRKFGINVEQHEKEGCLNVLSYDKVYVVDGRFNVNVTMSIWNKLYTDSLAKGFKGFRATGEMSCFFKYNLVKELLEYERTLHRALETPMIGICAYNTSSVVRNKAPISLYTELIIAHGTVLFAGKDSRLGKIEMRKI